MTWWSLWEWAVFTYGVGFLTAVVTVGVMDYWLRGLTARDGRVWSRREKVRINVISTSLVFLWPLAVVTSPWLVAKMLRDLDGSDRSDDG